MPAGDRSFGQRMGLRSQTRRAGGTLLAVASLFVCWSRLGFFVIFDLCTELLFGNYLRDLIGQAVELRLTLTLL